MLLLDVEEHDSVAISHRIATQLVTEDQIQQQDFGAVMRTLLLRRQHVGDHQGGRGLRNHFHSRNLSKLTMQVSVSTEARCSGVMLRSVRLASMKRI